MSSKKYASPLHLEIGSSRLLFFSLIVVHLFAAGLLFAMPLPFLLLIPCVLLVIVSGFYTVKFHALKTLSSSIVGLVWDANDEWLLLNKQGEKIEAVFDGNSFVHPWCSVLNFKQDNKFLSQGLILLPDNIDENTYRRLRVRLKVTSFHVTDDDAETTDVIINSDKTQN